MTFEAPTILLVAHSEYHGLYTPLALRLQHEFGARVHLYCGTDQELRFYRERHDSDFASIELGGALYAACRAPVTDPASVLERARRNEDELGMTINQLVQSDRHLGRGFSLGGFRHPRSRISRDTSYIQMVAGINTVIDFWRAAIDKHRPDLILNPGKVLHVLARHRSIPARHVANSRYKSNYYWVHNEYFESPAFEASFGRAPATADLEVKTANAAHLANRSAMRRNATLPRVAKDIVRTAIQHSYWHVRRYEKAKGYYASENIAYLWRSYRDVVRLANDRYTSLEELRKTPYVFFPLATEPETSLQMLSPEYTYQLSAIASIARDLPAGVTLAVKEHYAAVGRRPKDFHRQIAEFKNVRIVNMDVLGVEASRHATAVATITGTAGFEAAAMGIPVVAFGRHNIYNFLPHVFVVRDETELAGHLDRICRGAIDLAKARHDGRRFLSAVVTSSFDAMDYLPGRASVMSEAALGDAVAKLIDSAPGIFAAVRHAPHGEGILTGVPCSTDDHHPDARRISAPFGNRSTRRI